MSDDNITDLPQHIDIDLDAEERPPKDVKPPFRAKVGGRVIEMLDPAELDWRDLLLLQSPNDFIRHAVSREDQQHLYEQSLKGWKFNRLMEAYYAHYELEDKMREARRQQQLAGI